MDTSEQYILMCEKTEEIRALRLEEKHADTGKWKAGDFWTDVFRDGVFIVDGYRDAWSDEPHYIHHPIECIWLPRQDQLQEMVLQEGLLHKFFAWWNEQCIIPPLQSMEQLWLAFVMQEKYNKIWDGEEWLES